MCGANWPSANTVARRRGGRWATALNKFANRRFRVGDRSRGRFATPADFHQHDSSSYRATGFGICPSFKEHSLSRRAKPKRYDSQPFSTLYGGRSGVPSSTSRNVPPPIPEHVPCRTHPTHEQPNVRMLHSVVCAYKSIALMYHRGLNA